MAVHIDDTIVLRQVHTWLANAASDVTVLGLGQIPPASLGTAVTARIVSIQIDGQTRHSTDDAAVGVLEVVIEMAAGENQESVFTISSAAAKVRQAVDTIGGTATSHEISLDAVSVRSEVGLDEAGEWLRVCRMVLRGSVRCVSTATPEDRID